MAVSGVPNLRGSTLDRLTWDFVLEALGNKYMGEQYLDARTRELLDLVQG